MAKEFVLVHERVDRNWNSSQAGALRQVALVYATILGIEALVALGLPAVFFAAAAVLAAALFFHEDSKRK